MEYFKILIGQFKYVKSPHVFKDHCDSAMVQYSLSLAQWVVKNELAYPLKNELLPNTNHMYCIPL